MAKFKQLTEHGTKDKVTINLDLVLFIRSHARSSDIYFSDQHRIEVNELVNDIMQTPPLTNA
jgi:hypothetical protein